MAAWRNVIFGLIVNGPAPERVNAREVTEDYLTVHGVAPALGRAFTREDRQAGAAPVVMLGHGYWLRRFGGDRDVIGRPLRGDEGVATIVGIVPR